MNLANFLCFFWGAFLLVFCSTTTLAQDSDDFFSGSDAPWGIKIDVPSQSPLVFRIGARLHTVAEYQVSPQMNSLSKVKQFDFFLRRTRFQFELEDKRNFRFYMDVRNDNVNRKDSGESDFNVGDAFIEFKNLFGSSALTFRGFRAKVDVSRSETVSSSELMFLNRAAVADEAAQYVSQNRRATNIQLLGDFGFLDFQVVFGDGVEHSSFSDAKGNNIDAIDSQHFMYGSKLRFSVFDKKRMTETYFGEGHHVSLGVGYFSALNIEFRETGGAQGEISRKLINLEFSAHYKNVFLSAEAFRFFGLVEDHSVAPFATGKSTGYYAQLEVVFPSFCYLAPFFRYEEWDRFDEKVGYDYQSYLAGINWYINRNKVRLALAAQYDSYEGNIRVEDGQGREFDRERKYYLTSMWLF